MPPHKRTHASTRRDAHQHVLALGIVFGDDEREADLVERREHELEVQRRVAVEGQLCEGDSEGNRGMIGEMGATHNTQPHAHPHGGAARALDDGVGRGGERGKHGQVMHHLCAPSDTHLWLRRRRRRLCRRHSWPAFQIAAPDGRVDDDRVLDFLHINWGVRKGAMRRIPGTRRRRAERVERTTDDPEAARRAGVREAE